MKFYFDRKEIGFASIIFLATVIFSLVFGDYIHIVVDGKSYWHAQDDHMITQRVAFNFWKFGVPYFNVGEPVSANTSLFWPIIISNIYYFSSYENAVLFVILLTIIIYAAIVVLYSSYFDNIYQKVAIVMLLAASPTAFIYAPSGWEHIPQALLISIALFDIIVKSSHSGHLIVSNKSFLLTCLSFIFRGDSAIMILIIGLFWIFSQKRYARLYSYILVGLVLLIPIVYFVLMLYYYGSITTNTAYLKIMPLNESLGYAIRYYLNPMRSGPVPLMVAVLAGFYGFMKSGERFIFLLAVAQIIYVAAVGGDVFAAGRFFIIIFPAVTLIFIEVTTRAFVSFGVQHAPVASAATVVAILMLWYAPPMYHLVRGAISNTPVGNPIEEQIRVSAYVNKHLSPADGSVGLHYLGIGYHTPDFHVVDFLGKAESHIAHSERKFGPIGHNKWDYDYALRKYNIAVIPYAQAMIDAARTEAPDEKKNFVFWSVGARAIEKLGTYYFLPATVFGNEYSGFGAYIKKDLASKMTDAQ